jgi:hypothetical protein
MTPRTTTRDRGLALISRFNRWLIAGAVAASGLISLTAAHAFRGHPVNGTAASSGAGGATAATSSAPAPSPSASGQDGGSLQQPAQAPAPVQSAPSPVVSGGS